MESQQYHWKWKLFLCLLAPSIMLGQASLQGLVSDSANSEPLPGVSVVIQGTSLGAATDIDGRFKIFGIPDRQLTIRVSYVGYEPKFISVDFISQNDRSLNVKLRPVVIQGEEVIITGQMKGQVAAINQQLTSRTIVNVVSEEKIQELPDANAAEAIGRLPGVSIIRSGGEANRVVLRGLSSKFSNITVDGVKIPPTDPASRDVDLSTISQGSLAGIELFKALTADKDADAIAGSVNLVTKRAPSERLIRFDAKGDYNALMNSIKQYDLSARYGERFFDDIFGVQVTGNLERRIRSNERINIDYTFKDKDPVTNFQRDYEIADFQLQFIDEIRKRNGLQLLFDVNTPDDGSIKLNTIYGSTNRDYVTYQRNYPFSVNDITYSARNVEQEVSTFSSSLLGTNRFLDLELSWGLSYAESKTDVPFDYYLDFLEPSSTISGMKPGVPSIKDRPEQLIQYAWNNFSAATCSSAFSRKNNSLDKEKTAYLDVKGSYTLGDLISGELKGGGKYREKNRSRENSQLYAPYYLGSYWKDYVKNPDGSFTKKDFRGSTFDRFYTNFLSTGDRLALASDFLPSGDANRNVFAKYMLTPLLDRNAIHLWHDLNINGYDPAGGALAREYYSDPTVSVNDYDITERVAAAYAMNTLNIGQEITLIAGVRVEKEVNDYNSRFSPDEATGFPLSARVVDTSASYSELIWLPNFHATVRPLDFLSFRLAAYRALARPDFNLRLEQYSAVRSGATTTLQLGNSKLKTAKAWNYEVNTSIFGSTVGLISISGFYKTIDDIPHQLNGAYVIGDSLYRSFGITWTKPSFANSGYALTVPYNSTKPTKVWGVEFEHQMNFSFLPGYLQYIVLSYNFSISRSETYLISTSTKVDSAFVPSPRGGGQWVYLYSTLINESKQRSEGQPELFGNAALGYDIGGFSVRLSMFYQGEYNQTFSTQGTGDVVVDSYTRWDLAFKQQLTENVSVMLNVNNLTGIQEGTSIRNRVQGWHLADTQELFGLSADLGVRITL